MPTYDPWPEGAPQDEEIGRRIAAALALAELDQKEMAKRAGLSESAASRLLKKGEGLRPRRLFRIAMVIAGSGALAADWRALVAFFLGISDHLPLRKSKSEGSSTK